ncbi:homoserine kinase [Arthrobacter agilis]|nr:homoserine kinase [Arthrobacter agilis]PPB46460.1 homoserine kinase [Arthrobacter agilis]TPV23885.1 homoserine kinase [Arthrobacter agilis]VDR32631.1 Homoserine kinase [Arthrobacter agilis]
MADLHPAPPAFRRSADTAGTPEPAELPGVDTGQAVEIRVPATSANLGPGFDTLGLALALHDTVRVRTTTAGTTTVRASGEGAADLPNDATHLVARSLLGTLDRVGFRSPGLELDTTNVIPHGRGLGSSAAAIVAGVLAANALLPAGHRLDEAQVLQWAASLEGHPDNVAPALMGSLAISWESGHAYHSSRVEVHPDVVPVLAVPDAALSTESARALLPPSVSHHSAAANAGRAALLVHALSADPSLLFPATQDSLHQDYRAQAMLPSATLMRGLRSAGFASTISGAGPSIMTLAVGQEQADAAESAIARLLDQGDTPRAWRVLRLAVERVGAKVEVHQG